MNERMRELEKQLCTVGSDEATATELFVYELSLKAEQAGSQRSSDASAY